MAIIAMKTLLIILTLLPFTFPLTKSTTTITAVYKDQVPCTICYSCDNPCQPIPLPPPPPPPIPLCPPPPPPPSPRPPPIPPAVPECPPPPAPVPKCPACPLPPTIIPGPRAPPIQPQSPPNNEFYSPPGYGTNPTPYSPNYYYNPPLPSSAFNSAHFKLLLAVFAVFVSLTNAQCFF